MKYLKTFKNYRWIVPLLLIIPSELLLLIFSPIYSTIFPMWQLYFGNFIFWIIIDFTIGIGIIEKNIWKNISGILFIIFIIVFLIYKFKIL